VSYRGRIDPSAGATSNGIAPTNRVASGGIFRPDGTWIWRPTRSPVAGL